MKTDGSNLHNKVKVEVVDVQEVAHAKHGYAGTGTDHACCQEVAQIDPLCHIATESQSQTTHAAHHD